MKSRFVVCTLLVVVFVVQPLRAAVKLSAPFTSHMVLQRELSVPVWGTADAGEKVTVEFAGQSRSTVADAAGRWRVLLDPLAASVEGRTLKATGSSTGDTAVELTDVLVGEVWLASGQSNMDFTLGKTRKRAFAGGARRGGGNRGGE